jgi:hypothetical protein
MYNGFMLFLYECDAVWIGKYILTFQRILLPPSSTLKTKIDNSSEPLQPIGM